MELAIKRELAYREKLARQYPEYDWKKEFLPLEVPSSSGISSQNPSSGLLSNLDMVVGSTHSVAKANTSASSSHSLPNNELQPGLGPYPFPDLSMVASHQVPSAIAGLGQSQVENWNRNSSLSPDLDIASNYSINKEKATATSFRGLPYQRPRPLHIDNTNWFCHFCKVNCTTPYNYKQHVKGQKHKAKLQLLQMSRNAGGLNKPQQPMCKLCQIWCSDETSLESHFKGQKHQAKLMEIENGQKGSTSQHLWCDLCQVPCTNEYTFRMHLEGKTHAARKNNWLV